MTQEDKELLLKDLSARLPCGVMCHANEINLDGELLFVNKAYNIVALYNDKAVGKFDTCPIADVKPYLRPMSSMTVTEEYEYHQCCQMDFDNLPEEHSKLLKETTLSFSKHIDWLNAHHFDYRDLIEKGLALEAPERMYEF